jgi:hypothetical protein
MCKVSEVLSSGIQHCRFRQRDLAPLNKPLELSTQAARHAWATFESY